MNKVLLWVAFNIFVLIVLALDLGVFHRKVRVIKIMEAKTQDYMGSRF